MTLALQPSALRRTLAGWTTAVFVAAAFCVVLADAATAASKGGAIPLPRPNPNRSATVPAAPAPVGSTTLAATDDAIGSLIATDDAGERASSEDSDMPAAALSDDTPPPAASPGPFRSAGLKKALERLDANDPAGATLAAYALPNRVDIKLVDWLIATSGYQAVSSSALATLRKKLTDWPSQSLIQLRYEQALVREAPPAAAVIATLGGSTPQSDDATLLLAQAYLDTGHKDDAAALIRNLWRTETFAESTEKQIVKNFGSLLRTSDSKYRMDRLLYDDRTSEAVRAAGHLDKDQRALASAVALVIKESSKAGKALDALSARMKREPVYLYARIKYLRHADKIDAAAAMLLDAPRDPKVLIDPDAWWVERRLVSRELIEKGDAKRAYAIVAAHAAESPTMRAEAEFHAGWYALEFLHDPKTAIVHFGHIAGLSTTALSLSRAEYWQARASADAGDTVGAAAHFRNAAAYPTAFYGQLAIARLGGRTLPLAQPAPASADVRARFESRELVQAIRHLTAIGESERTGVFYRALADTLTDPSEIALVARMAEENGLHTYALQVGKAAAARGLPVDVLAYPTAAIPASAKLSNVEKPMVYAIARQESAFNANAVSGAGARGLLQMMPATAKETAKAVGLPYSKARLTSDPSYNATLGAAHLASLVDRFGGSYVMMFAAYNAGGRRVDAWVNAHGDPRDPKVDVVNWIELIPFTETRNYVQRIMENMQVYRARFDGGLLTIDADLKAGTIARQ